MSFEKSTYGLVGYPLGHSFSKEFFAEKFRREGLNAEYLNFEIDSIDKIHAVIASHPTLRGFNVTIPYKQAIIPYLDTLSPLASRTGAVNVVKVEHTPDRIRLHGYNSDCGGFYSDIAPLLRRDITQALVLGKGGAARAVATALELRGIAPAFVTRRHADGCLLFEQITPDIISATHLIVQCTPLGMYPRVDTVPDIPYQAIGPRHVCYDVVYNPSPTEFLRRCQMRGAVVRGGLGMLHAQARIAWDIWQGSDSDTEF